MPRALIVEDIADVRVWLSGVVVGACPGATVDVAANAAEARYRLARQSYDLALVDLGLPDGSGMDVVRAIKGQTPETLAIVATINGDDASIVGALAAGADGYLLKDQPADILTRQIRQALAGVPALSPAIARRIMQHFCQTGPAAEEPALTGREADVLSHIGRGLRNAEVAETLGIAEATVAGHIKAVYRKLGIGSRAEAAWHAARLGL